MVLGLPVPLHSEAAPAPLPSPTPLPSPSPPCALSPPSTPHLYLYLPLGGMGPHERWAGLGGGCVLAAPHPHPVEPSLMSRGPGGQAGWVAGRAWPLGGSRIPEPAQLVPGLMGRCVRVFQGPPPPTPRLHGGA